MIWKDDSINNPNDLRAILMTAATSSIGILIRHPQPAELRQALYRARQGDPVLADLQIRLSPFPDGDLVICHNRRQPP